MSKIISLDCQSVKLTSVKNHFLVRLLSTFRFLTVETQGDNYHVYMPKYFGRSTIQITSTIQFHLHSQIMYMYSTLQLMFCVAYVQEDCLYTSLWLTASALNKDSRSYSHNTVHFVLRVCSCSLLLLYVDTNAQPHLSCSHDYQWRVWTGRYVCDVTWGRI